MMNFHSILYEHDEGVTVLAGSAEPACFGDLNLDQVVNAITAGRGEYDLKPFFYAPLRQEAAIQYRQEVAQDLEHAHILESIRTFAEKMRTVRRYLALIEKLYYQFVLIFFNESFAVTNEREGAEIAHQIVRALLARRIKVFYIT